MDASGYIYAATRRGDATTGISGLIKYAPDGSIVAEELTFDALDVTLRNGYVYVTVPYGYRRYDTNLNFVDSYNNLGFGNGQFMSPNFITSDADGNIYISDSTRDDIQKLSGDGVYLATIGAFGFGAGQVNGPQSLVVDGDGGVYVAETGNNRVPNLNLFPLLTTPGPSLWLGVVLSRVDHLWEATQANANFAYRTLTYQGFTKENIRYLSPANMDLDLNGLLDDMIQFTNDGNARFQDAIGTWAADADNLVIYIVDHGGVDTVRMSGNENSWIHLTSGPGLTASRPAGKWLGIRDA